INNCNNKNIEKLPLLINEFVQKGNDHVFYQIFDNYYDRKLYFLLTKYNINEWQKNFGKLMYNNDVKIYNEKMSWRIEKATILNFNEKSEKEIINLLKTKLEKISV
ncbi:17947_t:CDS:1, partial [Dentiscutata erythropus]